MTDAAEAMLEASGSLARSPTAKAAAFGPTAPAKRIELLDILRGFALLGVLLMHIEYFVPPSYTAVMEADRAGRLATQGPVRLPFPQ